MPRSVVDIEQDPSTVTHTQPTRAELDPQRAVQHVKSPEEKRYLRKLDICLMTYACCSQIMKYLDQQAINFAWTSGLQTDLNLHGNELNYFLTYFNIGYCIFLIPSQVMITWFRPCIWLSTLELVWGGLTMALAATHNAKQIYVIRVFIGIAESSAYPGAVTLLTSWYTPTEMIKRIGLYHSSQAMGALLAGALQAAILKTLDGKAGLAGWRWTFIIDGLITLGIALIGYFMIPDFPDRPNRLTPYLNANDKAIAEDRLARWKRKTPKAVNWPTFVRLAKNPMTYGFIWLYAGLLLANYGYNYLNLFLQSLTNPDGSKVWTREALAAIPIGGYAIQIASVWFFAFLSDFFRTRWTLILAMALIGGVSTLILTIWNVSLGAKYYACITTYYAFNAWANVLIYPASKAPRYTVGWPVCFGIFCSCILVVIAFRLYDVKAVRPRNYRAAKEEERVQLEAQAEALAREGGDKKDKDEVSMAVLQEVRSL